MPFMTLDRTFLFYIKRQSKLGCKPNQEQIFGSLDSSKEIYRSTEESSATISQTSFDSNDSSNDSVYDSAGNVNYQQGIFDTNCSQDLKHNREDKCPFIFVTGESKNNTWPKIRNVHQNNGFDSDSDDSLKLGNEKRPDQSYNSIISDDLSRKDRSRHSETVNVSWSRDSLIEIEHTCRSSIHSIGKDVEERGRNRLLIRWNDLLLSIQGFFALVIDCIVELLLYIFTWRGCWYRVSRWIVYRCFRRSSFSSVHSTILYGCDVLGDGITWWWA